ncbi:hypothetical protein PAAG_11877 [Paracoccidioides lutzii Pb01]|uniref:Uncharacterized protein n=1 Tax=Paracoccidioides lutzii (strain ATCC MYA-826 / Pb01) TaxID=502779 RepID=A0A0A2V1M5_PARBA|nr:hypothetical protein PAAG_11877 [Paracoccidioides lutzii Pb01]KGQ01413.1 hypothetical protein PAAG_11877 [Paracoccidioides lutzii Pb01]
MARELVPKGSVGLGIKKKRPVKERGERDDQGTTRWNRGLRSQYSFGICNPIIQPLGTHISGMECSKFDHVVMQWLQAEDPAMVCSLQWPS